MQNAGAQYKELRESFDDVMEKFLVDLSAAEQILNDGLEQLLLSFDHNQNGPSLET